ncbi:MAG: GNAT family N-acetyltransferase [Mycobacterium sp.]|nr:MAG: GNAT family N-acetyltransferase [Mycobacterium sp.]
MTIGTATFRPDAAAGYGHLSRSLALATAWRAAGGDVVVDAPGIDDQWRRRYADLGASFTPARSDWCILDGYSFGTEEQRAARADHDRLLVIDDHASLGTYDTDVLLDHNIGATRVPGTDAVQLLGTGYLLLRPEFDDVDRSLSPDRRRILLAPGGAPDRATATLFEEVAAIVSDAGAEAVWLRGVDDVASAMTSAGAAVAAAGVTAYELCRVGTPSILVAVAANQEPVGTRLAARGAVRYAGRLDSTGAPALAEAALRLLDDPGDLSAAARQVVDGRGAKRVVAVLRSFRLDFRAAGPDYAVLTWEWANDPEVRRQSFASAPIPLDEHRAWFDRRLADPNTDHAIALLDGTPIGQVRFERSSTWTLNYLVAPEHRGRGLAAPMLVAATRRLSAGPNAIEALVKPGNTASSAALDLAGFRLVESDDLRLRYVHP